MAFSVRIIGISKTGQALLQMEPPWWEADQLKKDERFVFSRGGSYADYDADLSIEEMKELHEKFKKAAVEDAMYFRGPWLEYNKPKLEMLDTALYSKSGDYAHFHVTVFEWESGY